MTDYGNKVCEASNYQDKARLLKDTLQLAEPCNTALTLVSNQGKASARQISKVLRDKGIEWDEDENENLSLVDNTLVDWAIHSELLTRNRRGEFVGSFETVSETPKSSFRSRQQVYKEYSRSKAAARKKLRDARAKAWKTYREDMSEAKAAHETALAETRNKERRSS